MTPFSPSTAPGPLPPDTQPGNLPSQPNVGLWSDSDVGLPQGPATAFVTNQASASEKEMPTIGHIGRYALKYRIGAGGLGTVFAAHDPLLSRLVAIKTLSLELSADERESFNTLFLDEARAAGGLSHPHIVTVFDAGVSDNSAYIAMEMLKGRDLRQLRQEGWRPSPAQAALIVRRVADALAYAHSKGVVHRDVKPANIFMVGRTQPRVLDFGIARVAHRHDIGSGGDIVAGSPYYMAPEQARQQLVDRRADVFSLGVVMYELLADRKPFRGGTLAEITNAVLSHEPPLASEVDPKVPRGLAEIAARAMLKDPEQRYRSARAFARDLRHWLDDNSSLQDGEVVATPPSKARRRWVMGGLGGLVVAGVVLAVALAPRSRSTSPVAASDAQRSAAPTAPQDAVAPPPVAVVPGVVTATGRAPASTTSGGAAARDGDTARTEPLAKEPATGAVVPSATAAAAATAAANVNPAAPRTATAPPAQSGPADPGSNLVPSARSPSRPAEPNDKAAAAGKPAAGASAKTMASKPTDTKVAAAPTRRPADTREIEAKAAASAAAAASPTAAPRLHGTLRIAITPWGHVEVDGVAAGTTPPLNELALPEGKHQIVIRNGDFPPLRSTVTVSPGQVVSLKHKFGS